jgi:glycerol-3-phosphate O-acyltransferase
MLIHSYKNLKRFKYDIKIVPVCINYDRLFDASYLANEMISGKMEEINLYELMKYIQSMRAGKLGKVFVKYADPIDLDEYVSANGGSNLSLKLTRDLY